MKASRNSSTLNLASVFHANEHRIVSGINVDVAKEMKIEQELIKKKRFIVLCDRCHKEMYIGPRQNDLLIFTNMEKACMKCLVKQHGPEVLKKIRTLGGD